MPKISKFFVQFNANRNEKISFTNLDDTTTVKELKEKILEQKGNGLGQVGTLVYLSKSMKDDKTLAYYGVKKLRTIFATFKLHGGTLSISGKTLDLEELSKLTVQTSTHECELFGTFGSCKTNETKRMRLPVCTSKDSKHCWYCYKCLRETVKRAVSQYKSRVECPRRCGYFDFDTVLFCCHFDEEKEADLLYEYEVNELKKQGARACPGCQNYVTKPKEIIGNRVRCPNSSCKWNSNDFCFLCGSEWKNELSNYKCGSEECEDDFIMFVDSQIKESSTRSYTYSVKVGTIENIPIKRLCPNPSCHHLIVWEDKCKHLTCKRCDHGYCQSCLKAWSTCKCGWCRENEPPRCDLDKKCTPAPTQDVIDLLSN